MSRLLKPDQLIPAAAGAARPGKSRWRGIAAGGFVAFLALCASYAGFIYWLYIGSAGRFGLERSQGEEDMAVVRINHLRGNLYMIAGAGSNVTALVGHDGVLIVDSGEPWAGPAVQAVLAQVTDRPVRYVINTHSHGDHRGGNGFFRKRGAEIVAHEQTYRNMLNDGYATAAPDDMPTITFRDRHLIAYGGEVVTLTHIPNAHTNSDIVAYFPQTDIISAGDLFTNEGLPFVSEGAGATIDGYLRGQRDVIAMMGNDTIVVPGHGPGTAKKRYIETNERLTRVRDTVAFWKSLGVSQRMILATYPTWAWPLEWRDYGPTPKYFARMTWRTVP